MFEIWVATWCMSFSFFAGERYCSTRNMEVFVSSSTAVHYMIAREMDEFWLYPLRDIESEVWHFKINRNPWIEIEKTEPLRGKP